MQLHWKLDARVVVGRDLVPVHIVERVHRGRIVGVDLERKRVVAGEDAAGDVERVASEVTLHRRLGGNLLSVQPDIRLPDDSVDDQCRVLPGSQRAVEVGAEPPRHRKARHCLTSDAGHVAEAGLHVVGEEDVRALAVLQHCLHLGARRAGVIRRDVEEGGGVEARRRDDGAGLGGDRAALDLPPAGANGGRANRPGRRRDQVRCGCQHARRGQQSDHG